LVSFFRFYRAKYGLEGGAGKVLGIMRRVKQNLHEIIANLFNMIFRTFGEAANSWSRTLGISGIDDEIRDRRKL
jgi:hypothetical protein